MEDMYQAYNFCRTFHCSLAEYEARPYEESRWMLEIDKVHKQAQRDVDEKARKKQDGK